MSILKLNEGLRCFVGFIGIRMHVTRRAFLMAGYVVTLASFLQGVEHPSLDRVGTTLGSHVRVRRAPSLTAEALSSLQKNEDVFVIGRSSFSSIIDGMDSPWLWVVNGRGGMGWVFGGYINQRYKAVTRIDEPDPQVKAVVSATTDLKSGAMLTEVVVDEPSEYGISSSLVLFVRSSGTPPYIIDTLGVGGPSMTTGSVSVSTVNLQGDGRGEIAVNFEINHDDGGGSDYLIYGSSHPTAFYRYLGAIHLLNYYAGTVCGEGSTVVLHGPEVVRFANGHRGLSLTTKNVSRERRAKVNDPSSAECVQETSVVKSSYGWDEVGLFLMNKTVLSSTRTMGLISDK